MSRPLAKRCPRCGLRQKDLPKHLPRCALVYGNRHAQKQQRPWITPAAPSGRNVVNRYTCQRCAAAVVTVDRHEGVTPFLIRCEQSDCGAMMASAFYGCDQMLVPTHEWRAPTAGEYRRAHPDMRHHFDQGGLDLHRIEGATA